MKMWKTKTLEDVCQFSNGLWKGEKPPFVNVGVIRNTNFTKEGTLDDSDIAHLDVEAKKLEKRRLQFGDIILEKSGGGPKQPVGRVALFDKEDGDFSFSNFTAALRVLDPRELDFRFLHRFLHWTYLSGITEGMQSHSTGIRNLDGDAYKAIKISFPPLPEQQRIVKLLDEADELRKLRAQADRRTAALIPALFHDMFGDVGLMSGGSRRVRLEEVADKVTDGEHLTPKRTTGGIKLLSARNVRDGFLDFTNVDYIGLEEHQRIKKRCDPECGDILISCSGTIGRVAVVQTHEPFSLVRSVALVKLKKDVLRPMYLQYYLRTPFMAAKMSATANASSQANLFQNQIRALPVLIPEIALQDRFVERASEIRELEVEQTTSRECLEALFQSMLHRAFGGEL